MKVVTVPVLGVSEALTIFLLETKLELFFLLGVSLTLGFQVRSFFRLIIALLVVIFLAVFLDAVEG